MVNAAVLTFTNWTNRCAEEHAASGELRQRRSQDFHSVFAGQTFDSTMIGNGLFVTQRREIFKEILQAAGRHEHQELCAGLAEVLIGVRHAARSESGAS